MPVRLLNRHFSIGWPASVGIDSPSAETFNCLPHKVFCKPLKIKSLLWALFGIHQKKRFWKYKPLKFLAAKRKIYQKNSKEELRRWLSYDKIFLKKAIQKYFVTNPSLVYTRNRKYISESAMLLSRAKVSWRDKHFRVIEYCSQYIKYQRALPFEFLVAEKSDKKWWPSFDHATIFQWHVNSWNLLRNFSH